VEVLIHLKGANLSVSYFEHTLELGRDSPLPASGLIEAQRRAWPMYWPDRQGAPASTRQHGLRPVSYLWITLLGHRNWSGPAVSSYREAGGVTAMEDYLWFLLGMLVVWTPGLLALALLLRRSSIDDIGQNSADNRL
jgi:hypothetical protein